MYGPYRRRITPVKKKVLSDFRSGGTFVAKSTRGIEGRHFVEAAVDDLESKMPNILQQAVNKLE